MEKDPQQVARLAEKRRDENWRFRSFLKMLSRRRQREVNRIAEQYGLEAESRIDCRECGACCRDNAIPVSEEEIERLAGRLGLSPDEVRAKYISHDEAEGDHIDARPCPFLNGNLCSVYDSRPEGCRGYPYIGGDIATRTIGIIERAGTCPIIFDMLERLKDAVGFRRYR
ncbi:MAG TPA: YkgJ family cysteine cluster protein [Phycisphaerae bacterium]|nr:YkgJ family cysteine cluster protein [Phycisphaerae bacterium]HRR83744.1 YkgJ family cysteine cluster protein [Phycisphaerae bacterium]